MKTDDFFGDASSFARTMRTVLRKSDELVLFGSRSSMLHAEDSDWDVLCVAENPPLIQGRVARLRLSVRLEHTRLDLIWISPSTLSSGAWLGSELASHVASYGVWLVGSGEWRTRAAISSAAVAAKHRRVKVRVAFQRQYGPRLLAPYLAKHLTLLRRDIQRLYCLQTGIPVPSTPHLDTQWRERRERESILRLARSFEVDLKGC